MTRTNVSPEDAPDKKSESPNHAFLVREMTLCQQVSPTKNGQTNPLHMKKNFAGGNNGAFKKRGVDWRDSLVGEVLAAKPDDPSSIPGHHTVEGENQYPEIVL